ncbi:MAG TPA: DUF1653 domain-containing protein [Mobilitalea sp.]|mgnify:CR=1 FL=1|nr:DUF1653 domain-containing protein [Mobilitalea sp.]
MSKIPGPGEIFYLTKDKPYQVITIGIHKETCENMVIYQALFDDFKTYVLPVSKFLSEFQQDCKDENTGIKEPEKVSACNMADNASVKTGGNENYPVKNDEKINETENFEYTDEKINEILLSFLDAKSYSKKLEIVTTHIKAMDDRLINNMAASLDCTVNDGPLEKRLQELIYCLKQMSRFEDRRLR